MCDTDWTRVLIRISRRHHLLYWTSWTAWLFEIQASESLPPSFRSTPSWRSAPMQPLWLNWYEALVEAWGSYSSRGLVYVVSFCDVALFFLLFWTVLILNLDWEHDRECILYLRLGNEMADSATVSLSTDTAGKCVSVRLGANSTRKYIVGNPYRAIYIYIWRVRPISKCC